MSRGSSLSALSIGELQREVSRRRGRVGALVKKHRRLLAKANTIAEQIHELGGSVERTVGSRKRARNDVSLVDALANVLRGKTMSVTDAAEAVQKAGYRTTSKSFRTIVNIALINSGEFKRVDRGQYTAK